MKKILSVLMATLMFLTLLMPLNVFAENGPYPVDWENVTEEELENIKTISMIGLMDYTTFEIGYLYPEILAEEMPVNSKGLSYDEKTNTLTLNNHKSNMMLSLGAMGDDFKINVVGYNEIGCIGSIDMDWGGSVTITGNGVLVINEKKTYPASVTIDVSDTGYGFFKTEESVSVKLTGNISTELADAEPTIWVLGTKEADTSKVIMLNGDVKASKESKKDAYEEVLYEQTEVVWVDETYVQGDFYKSEKEEFKDKLFIGELYDYEEELYDVYEVVYDEELQNYIITYSDGLQSISLEDYGFEKLSGNATVPATILEVSSEPIELDTCIDENDKTCVFIDYSYEEAGGEIEVYEIFEHSKYGKLALIYNPKNTYKELKVVSTETYYNHFNESTTITINTIATSVPAKVTLKKAASAFGGVKVTWNTVDGASRYKVYRSQYDTKTKKWTKWSVLGYSETASYLDKTAKNGVKYKYTVRAENMLGLGGYDKAGVSTTYIAAPTVKIANTASGIKVSWSKVSGATGYTVYRSQFSGGKWSGWKNMGTLKSDKSAWTDKNVKSGVQYKYTVRTVKNKLMSSYKGTAGLVFLSQPTVKIANASTGVKVSWSKVSGATGYTVYRSELSNGKWSSWKKMGTAKSDKSAWTDKSAKSGTQYKYTVRAVNGNSKSTYKATSGLLYLAQPTVKIANASNGIKVSWNKVSGATGYTVYRSQYSDGKWSGWKNMGTAKSDKSSWTDKNVKSGIQYKYTVRAVNGNFKSSYKASSALKYLVATKLSYVEVKEGIKLSWNKVPGAKSYVIYRNMNDIGRGSGWTGYTEYKTLDNKTTTWIDKDVVELSVAYTYKVYAVNGDSKSVCVTDSGTITRTNRGVW